MPGFEINEEATIKILSNLQERLSDIHMFFLDTDRALTVSSVLQERQQHDLAEELSRGPEGPIKFEELDTRLHYWGTGHPEDPATRGLTVITRGERRARCAPGGLHREILHYSIISLVYSLWNDEYRPLLAGAMGAEVNDLVSDIYGDIRLIRNSIVHHSGIALPEIERCKVYKYFKRDQKINFTVNQLSDLIIDATREVESFSEAWFGRPTGYHERFIGPLSAVY